MNDEQEKIAQEYRNQEKSRSPLAEELEKLGGKFPDVNGLNEKDSKTGGQKIEQAGDRGQSISGKIAEFFVSREATEEYFSGKIKGGRKRKEGAVKNFTSGLAEKLDKVDLGDVSAVNETARKFANSANTKLGEVVKKHFKQWSGEPKAKPEPVPSEENPAESSEAPKTKEEFEKRFKIGIFYVNKKDASDLKIIRYDPGKKQAMIELSFKFREKEPEFGEHGQEPTRVWSIEQRGGEKTVAFEELEKMMEDYVPEDEFHRDDFAEERTKPVEHLGAKYVNGKGQTLELFKYKKGRKVSRSFAEGTIGARIDGESIGFKKVSEVEKLIEKGGFELEREKNRQDEKVENPRAEKPEAKPQKPDGEGKEQMEFDEKEKKTLEAYKKFARAYLEEIETYDYESEGYLKKFIPNEKKRQAERFWEVVLPQAMKKRKNFPSDELIEKAIEEIKRIEKK